MKQELEELDATACAELIRRGEVSPLEMVDAAIARIEERNPALNAVVTPMFELARARAQAPLPDGPFRGVPYLLKDLMGTFAGVRETSGSALLRDFIPPFDSELVSRLKAAGFIVLGKTNTPEFGILPTAESALLGPARNPWNRAHSTGGSSGGSAAAVAARMVPAAHANDGGGSIRIPASWCGLFGLKPTRARSPVGPDTGEGWSGLGVGHAITRSVRDSAALLDATHGPELGAPYVAPVPARPFIEEVGAAPGRLRIALATRSPIGTTLHPDVIAAAEDAAKLLSHLGHEVEEAVPDLDGEAMAWAYRLVIGANLANLVELRGQALGKTLGLDDIEPITRLWAEASRGRTAIEYARMTQIIHGTGRRLAQFFERYDVLLSPTVGTPPPVIGEISMGSDDLERYIAQVWDLVPFTLMINYAGTPAATLPLHWSKTGLPIGVQIATRYGDEATIFRLASQLEQARPWFDKRPTP